MTTTSDRQTLWDESGSQEARELAEMLQCVSQGPSGYRLRRIILTNFWLYDHQEFEIPHGRLFLSGDNYSGKSTVLTAAITLALDSDHRPERIDTFGKNAKRIDYYILGSNDSHTPYLRESRTSYVALEFEWCDPDHPPLASELRARWERGERDSARFFTIGVSFRGNRNNASPISPPLRFLITDGTRLEYDIPTTQSNGTELYATDWKIFRKAVLEHGMICSTQEEYEKEVASRLFKLSVNDFRRLIKMLLYLRQPNLSNVLSLDSVRFFLDESLPALPVDLVQHAAETLEKMEKLQKEVERRRNELKAVELLDQAQQRLLIVKAQLAACEYIDAQDVADEKKKFAHTLERQITNAENKHQHFSEEVKKLKLEQVQLQGQLEALRQSESLQRAEEILNVQDEVLRLDESLDYQRTVLEDCIRRREERMLQIERAKKQFEQNHTSIVQLLGTLQKQAIENAHWQLAAVQLAEQLEHVSQLSLSVTTLDMPEQVSTLLRVSVQERLTWLNTLKELHQELSLVNNQLQIVQKREESTYDLLDKETRNFAQAREQMESAFQHLEDRLDELLSQSKWLAPFITLSEQVVLVSNDVSRTESVQRLEILRREYVSTIEHTQKTLDAVLENLQKHIDSARKEQVRVEEMLNKATAAYEQKCREPEYRPARSEHRLQARERLEARGIPALPLYMLIDFAPEIDSESRFAGGLEHMLEDAGLLDALVVLPIHSVEADAVLSAEGLSDCRIASDVVSHVTQEQTEPLDSMHSSNLQVSQARLLRVDPALRELGDGESTRWSEALIQQFEEVAQRIVLTLELLVYPELVRAQANTWRHGLLSGIAGEGVARCVGKATRVREQQRELEHLRQSCAEYKEALKAVNQHYETLTQEWTLRDTLRTQIGRVVQESEIDNVLLTLKVASHRLTVADNAYQQERQAAQKLRERSNELKVRLQRDAAEVSLFAVSSQHVEQARESTTQLASEYKTVSSCLLALRNAWEEHRSAHTQLDEDKAAAWRAEQAKQRAEHELAEVRARLDMLGRLLDEKERVNVTALLSEKQARLRTVGEGLRKAESEQTKASAEVENKREGYPGVLAEEAQARQSCEVAYAYLVDQLDVYPIEKFIAVKQRVHSEERLVIAQDILSEEEFNVQETEQTKSKLKRRDTDEQNRLLQVLNGVNSLLHSYAAQFDEQGIIRFLNADSIRVHAHALLAHLHEILYEQEHLLEARERELFQNFLLEEMIDIVGKHIIQAQQWTDRMNATLSQTSFMDHYYRLSWDFKKAEQEQGQVSNLAQHHQLLRRQAQTFKQEEINLVISAFRQDIATLSQETNTTTFTEALSNLLDYRTWFQFHISISSDRRVWKPLTKSFFKTGSGAEQFAMLYIPFFMAFAVLYESAGAGVPRLIALDEAFEKISQEKIYDLLAFLVSQQFQWIMTGPRVTGEGAAIPACVKYTMFCQKDQELAVGFPSFWASNPLAEEHL